MRSRLFLVSIALVLGSSTPTLANPFQDAIDAVTDAQEEIEIAVFRQAYADGLSAGYFGRDPSISERIYAAGSAAYGDGYRRGFAEGRANRARLGL